MGQTKPSNDTDLNLAKPIPDVPHVSLVGTNIKNIKLCVIICYHPLPLGQYAVIEDADRSPLRPSLLDCGHEL